MALHEAWRGERIGFLASGNRTDREALHQCSLDDVTRRLVWRSRGQSGRRWRMDGADGVGPQTAGSTGSEHPAPAPHPVQTPCSPVASFL
eukprot:scaffold7899_cov111-Isochrysis_galbana.AAC.1